jgi:hypothetical protein
VAGWVMVGSGGKFGYFFHVAKVLFSLAACFGISSLLLFSFLAEQHSII